eukprot:GGOE01002264.1.p1 GENE.GGOE01002264.1~~GGOE01002264.1.p1  ORF type:complete len:356 (-),score=69.87 GGOE01002264.1:331-1302(-)
MEDEVSRAILKTTSHVSEPPNDKHLKRLITASKGADPNLKMDDILDQFQRRLHVRDTTVVLKTLVTMHCLLQDGGQPLVTATCKRAAHLFNTHMQLKDIADTPETMGQMRFIRGYMRYLEERSMASNACEMRLENDIFSNDQQWTSTAAANAMLCMKSWIPQLQVMTEMDLNMNDLAESEAEIAALKAVLKDSRRLYTAFTIRMIWMLERVSNLQARERKELLELFEAYCTQIRALNAMCAQATKIPQLTEFAVQLQELPASAVQKLKEAGDSGTTSGHEDVPDGVEVAPLDAALRNPRKVSAAAEPSPPPKPKADELDLLDL